MKKIILLFVLPVLLFSSCAVQKRKYQKGYYLNWHKTASHTAGKKNDLSQSAPVKKETAPVVSEESMVFQQVRELLASAANNKPAAANAKKQLKAVDPCDELVFKDGSEIKGKISEITPTEIKYKKCDMLDGPVYIARKSDVFMIKYANGTREVFKEEPKGQTTRTTQGSQKGTYNGPKQTHPLAIASLIMGILGFFPYAGIIFSILAIVFGNKALRKIEGEPDRYKGEGIATAGKVLGIVILALYALILLIFLIVVIALL